MARNVESNPADALQRAWALYVRGLVRSEMQRKGVTYRELTERLAALGISDDPQLLNNRIAAGKFSAMLFCQIMHALNVPHIDFRWHEEDTLLPQTKDEKGGE